MSIQTASSNQAAPSTTPPSQPSSVNVVQASNHKGNQSSDGKKKGRGKKKNLDGKGNVKNPSNGAGEGGNESKKKVKFPYKLCSGDHLTHL